ncbi:MAG: isopenicillin N synthase-like dioxygenase [Verrucomicrobiales bacterium]|jgi:isopenicillin N synthase-like dioxygenase
MSVIPVIDIAPLFDEEADHRAVSASLAHAAETVGFFSITGHGISPDLLARMRAMVAELFSVSEEDKFRQAITRHNYRGFIPLGFFTPNRDDPDAPTADRYEGFKLHWEVDANDPLCAESAIYGPNRWAEHPPAMRDTVLEYWNGCDCLARALLAAFEQVLGLSQGDMAKQFARPVTNMTLLHYPPSTPDENVLGIHPHKDTNVFTVLHPDPVGGLFVRTRDGDWVEATCPTSALLVNTGDMMEVWSGGRFTSTPHKVVNATGAERYAFPWFLAPDHDVVIAPLVDPQPGFIRVDPVEVGPWSLEVWRTNWPDETPSDSTAHLGTLDQ